MNTLIPNPMTKAGDSFGSGSTASSSSTEDPLAVPHHPDESLVLVESPAPLEGSSTQTPLLLDEQEAQQLSYKPRTTSRLGNSCRFILAGAFLCVGSLVTLVAYEWQAVHNRQFYSELHKKVHEINGSKDNQQQAFGLMHATGVAQTPGTVQDETFGMQTSSSSSGFPLKLFRYTQMYQWVESEDVDPKTGDYAYTLEWDSTFRDSNKFEEESHPTNPSSMPYPSQVFTASPVTLSGTSLTLSTQVMEKMNYYQVYEKFEAMQLENIPDEDIRNRASLQREGKDGLFLYIRASDSDAQHDPARDPVLGDSRVQFRVVVPQTVSVLGLVQDSTLVPFREHWYGGERTVLLVETGEHSAADMLQRAEATAQRHVSVIRWFCGALIYLGILVLGKPASVLEDALPAVRDLVGPNFALRIAVVRLLPLAVMVTCTAVALSWWRVHAFGSIVYLVVQAGVIYYAGNYLEWWGGGSVSHSGSQGKSQDMAYQLVDEQTLMELHEV